MLTAPARLGAARGLIEDDANDLVLSAVSPWEIAIKSGRGRLPLPLSVDQLLTETLRSSQIITLSIDCAHAARVASLPLHHRDPFDRMLVAQAQVEKLPILTADRAFAAYDCEVIRVG